MKKLFFLLLMIPLIGRGQQAGIHFENGLTWTEIQDKARAEHKYIFVDCFATWCGPCKLMDREVYPLSSVGEFMNPHFISVKVQMDSSKQDDDYVKSWYKDAQAIKNAYNVYEFPTYLFLSAEGKIVHRGAAAVRDTDFLKLARNALNPAKQYYTLIEQYRAGRKNYEMMPYLANRSQEFHADQLAGELARDYIKNYLFHLSRQELFNTKNIGFVVSFTKTSKDPGFKLFMAYPGKIDSAVNRKLFAENFVANIITKEDINPRLYANNKPIVQKPQWKLLRSRISKKYGRSYAERTLLDAQLQWYDAKNAWPEITRLYLLKLKRYGLDTSGVNWVINNNMIDDILGHCNDKNTLKKLLHWQKIIVEGHPANAPSLDTYANLFYKTGDRQQALEWERRAVALDPKNTEIKTNLEKMEQGKPTW
ncbi:MAG TPA: thioredoxin fold domain-containing protein [Mucilaginibacter sp.]